MTLWFSLPSIFIPESSDFETEDTIDPLYNRICDSFSYSPEVVKENINLPRAKMDAEDLACKVILSVKDNVLKGRPPGFFVDCRSSAAVGGPAPTYKLSAMTGLNKTLPICLSGQAGSEVAQAMVLLLQMGFDAKKNAIVSAVQRFVPPDTRYKKNGFPMADAAAAIAVSGSEFKQGRYFHLLGADMTQNEEYGYDVLEQLLNNTIQRSGITRDTIRWSIAHRFSVFYLDTVKKTLPHARWVVRDLYPEFDFGCADSLISLSRIFSAESFSESETGVLWFAGRFGSIGVLILNCCEKV